MSDLTELQSISGQLERGEIDSGRYVEQLVRFVAARIGCSRAGLRVFVDDADARVLRCIAMYDTSVDSLVIAADIAHVEGDRYLDQLQRDGYVMSSDGRHDPVINDSQRAYLNENGVVALMDMSFSVNGALFGTFACEHAGAPVHWTQRQLQSLRKIASRASLTLMKVVNASVDTTPGALWASSTPNRLTTIPMPLNPLSD